MQVVLYCPIYYKRERDRQTEREREGGGEKEEKKDVLFHFVYFGLLFFPRTLAINFVSDFLFLNIHEQTLSVRHFVFLIVC